MKISTLCLALSALNVGLATLTQNIFALFIFFSAYAGFTLFLAAIARLNETRSQHSPS